MQDLPKTLCDDCPPTPGGIPVLAEQLPDTLCPCPTPEVVANPYIYPSVVTETVTVDCFQSMLYNMVHNKYCTVPPKACN